MDSSLEEKRALQEERDRLELALVNEMIAKNASHKDKLDSEHRQKALLDRYMKCSQKLLNLYQQDNAAPVHTLDTNNPTTRQHKNPFHEFNVGLRRIKDFYVKHTNEQLVTLASEFEHIEAERLIALGLKTSAAKGAAANADLTGHQRYSGGGGGVGNQDDHQDQDEAAFERGAEIDRLARGLPTTEVVLFQEGSQQLSQLGGAQNTATRQEKLVEFTDEEGYGRYLDLIKCHEAFLQVIRREEVKPNYITFLDRFDRFGDLDRQLKLSSAYKHYVEMMLEYFRDYSRRARPLFDYADMEKEVERKFLEQWNDKSLPAWFSEAERLAGKDAQMIELESYKGAEELQHLGLECLKRELQARGLKCGGTLEERANRLWSVRGLDPGQIGDSLRAAPAINKKGKRKSTIEPFTIACVEAKLASYAEHYSDHRQATLENVQRKQARTAEERNESDDDISDLEEEDTETSDTVYNPKNLPLGWDGKPIPYWLYKLHGLNLTYSCEICGNAIYKGPKAFQRHFSEWRHAHGMRCLGIPNTAHFANITNIQDAISLWDKLKVERERDKGAVEEEYEDSQGNVVNKKTYEDLKRQGLL